MRLHYVEAGEGPLIVLLHGFPEFWYGWRLQIKPLAAAGFRVVAPDMRGYNLSSRPDGVAGLRHRPADRRHPRSHPRTRCRVRAAGRSRLGRKRRLGHRDEPPRGRGPAGHPQRGPSAEAVAGTAPPGPAPQVLVLLLLRPPGAARKPSCTPTTGTSSGTSCSDAHPAYTPEEIDRYIEAWSQPGAATGMINYYRSSVRTVAEARRSGASPDLGAHAGHLGAARSLPRPRTRRARPRRRTQPRPRRAPARRVALGASRRGRARHPTAHRLLRPRPASREPLMSTVM